MDDLFFRKECDELVNGGQPPRTQLTAPVLFVSFVIFCWQFAAQAPQGSTVVTRKKSLALRVATVSP